MSLHRIYILVFLSGFLFLKAQPRRDHQKKIDSLLAHALQKANFNGNVLIMDHGRAIYKRAIGYANSTGTKKLSTAHRFHIGSIAKEFNAVGIMLLAEQGKLKLSDKINLLLPQLPAWAAKVRVRDLLTYTSGVPDINWATAKSDADLMNDLIKTEKLDFEPGTQYAYNNNNVFLQRRIIEAVTGVSFRDFVYKKLLSPSLMDTAIIDPNENDPLIARAFGNSEEQDTLSFPISGWVAVTLDDLFKWSQQIVHFKIISPLSTRFLLIPELPSLQSGLGFDGKMDKNNRVIHFIHDGTAWNYQALLVCYPDKGRTVILLSNHKQNNLGEINSAVQHILDEIPE